MIHLYFLSILFLLTSNTLHNIIPLRYSTNKKNINGHLCPDSHTLFKNRKQKKYPVIEGSSMKNDRDIPLCRYLFALLAQIYSCVISVLYLKRREQRNKIMLSIYIKHIKNKYLAWDKNPFLLLFCYISLSCLFTFWFPLPCFVSASSYVHSLRICFDFNPLHNLFPRMWMQCSGNNSVDNFLYSLNSPL